MVKVGLCEEEGAGEASCVVWVAYRRETAPMRSLDYLSESPGKGTVWQVKVDEEKHQTMATDGDSMESGVNEHGRDGRSSAEVQVTARGSGSREVVAGESG